MRSLCVLADGEAISCQQTSPKQPTGQLFLFHGGGTSSAERYDALVAALVRADLCVTVVEFSGHGHSSGSSTELSLRRRFVQAHHAIAALIRPKLPLLVMGFSMSGQTVCDLLASGIHPIAGAVLACPAVYSPAAHGLLFGDPAFTAELRRAGSWRESPSFSVLQNYSGRVLLVLPEQDEVIPPEVTKALQAAAPKTRTKKIVLTGAGHQLGTWFNSHPADAARAARAIAGLVRA